MSEKLKSPASKASSKGKEIKVSRGTKSEKASRTPAEVEVSLEEMLNLPELSSPVRAEHLDIEGERQVWMRHEWERPGPSTVWRGAGGISIAIAATAIIAVLTIHDGSTPRISLPLAIGIGGAVVAAICGLAHYDANRGRKPKRLEIMDEPRSGERSKD